MAMTRRLLLVAGVAGLGAAAFAWAPRARASAQAGAPPPAACGAGDIVPALNAQPYQWKAGTAVRVWVDRTGSVARASHRNPRPRFALSERDAQSLFDGVNQWGGIPGTGVTFTARSANDDRHANYWITVTWPAADVVFPASDGNLKQVTCRVPPVSLRAAAYTCAFEDQVRGISQSHTIIGAVTMINTGHTYVSPFDGQSHDTWAYRGPGWQSALAKVGAHENGHLMGLADLPARFPGGSEAPHVMKPFNGTNDTAPLAGKPRVAPVTACDRAAVLDHPSRQYARWICAGPGAVAPPPCAGGGAPMCLDPASSFPAPVWACPVPAR